ncbi:hypothetical protein [Natronococcus wangiae]|uniref:hypothetical protein n=1 Tax=Natronococcus wangiae TaxID=3068275 RepID=UPI00273FF616|nr:hypothetical protein [Natronococcus sp. AD5]
MWILVRRVPHDTDALLEISLTTLLPLTDRGAFVAALFEGGYVLFWILQAIRYGK